MSCQNVVPVHPGKSILYSTRTISLLTMHGEHVVLILEFVGKLERTLFALELVVLLNVPEVVRQTYTVESTEFLKL